MTKAFTCTKLMLESHPIPLWLTAVDSKNMNLAYSHLDSEHGLTTKSASVPLLWNKYAVRGPKGPKPMSSAKHSLVWCPHNSLALGGSVKASMENFRSWFKGWVALTRERKFVWLVSKYQVPSLLWETKPLPCPSLWVSHRGAVWLRLLVPCTCPPWPYISVSRALISHFGPLPLFAWGFSPTSRNDQPVGMAFWKCLGFPASGSNHW